jgi:hypothetical protein
VGHLRSKHPRRGEEGGAVSRFEHDDTFQLNVTRSGLKISQDLSGDTEEAIIEYWDYIS